MQLLKRLVHEENGQGMAEYGLIIALVAIVLIGALGLLSDGIGKVFEKIGGTLSDEATSTQ
ncbi:Flp family type IVb pilin [Neomoorella mulderi]|uniref:Flp/Fap pilin component n=1 Tax=Moorella mulderi DSM 14980 TaxID=1122241 RepID=A0A151AZI4_9FIRM|nr:Flp family type IVb pilin [Moorella mulderi]KYH32952.1 Flp/Fap pilin component [Moorella mulderi DSM 14980]